MPVVVRVNSSSSNKARKRARLWLMADWPMPTRAAARVTFRSAAQGIEGHQQVEVDAC